ncbi:hypothetical protein FACS1894217_10620 [Clostridia bacterium]|nr:hypothetical protein FACS1894217_10620 [Clostridia bacterium]
MIETTWDFYRSSVKTGKKYVSEHSDSQWKGYPPVLEVLLPDYKECASLSLGLLDVPMHKIRGTLASGRSNAFAGNFMPLLGDHSEFAQKWMSLYESHLDEGIHDAGTAVEYLGYYYIIEGHKRVSVLRAVGSNSMHLEVNRVLPREDNDTLEAQLYREFIANNPRRLVKQMWFTRLGSSARLDKLGAEYELSEEQVEDAFGDFRRVYHKLGFATLTMSTGDAFLQFAEIYGFPYLWGSAKLGAALKALERQLLIDAPKAAARQIKPKTRRVVFVYDHTPAEDYADSAHDYGRRVLERNCLDIAIETVEDFADEPDKTAALEGIAEGGGIIFVANPANARYALRAQLTQKDTIIAQFLPETPMPSVLTTYYGRVEEPAFLLGVLAGVLTKNGRIAWRAEDLREAATAFALGARMVSDGARVSRSAQGCDVALLPYTGEGEAGHGFPGVFAQLATLNPKGFVSEYVAAMNWNFGALYTGMCTVLFDGGLVEGKHPGAESVRVLRGLDSGLLDISLNRVSLSAYTLKLLEFIRENMRKTGVPYPEIPKSELEKLIDWGD